MDKWLNLPDRSVSEGDKREGESGVGDGCNERERKRSRHYRVKDGRREKGGESDKQRQRG